MIKQTAYLQSIFTSLPLKRRGREVKILCSTSLSISTRLKYENIRFEKNLKVLGNVKMQACAQLYGLWGTLPFLQLSKRIWTCKEEFINPNDPSLINPSTKLCISLSSLILFCKTSPPSANKTTLEYITRNCETLNLYRSEPGSTFIN